MDRPTREEASEQLPSPAAASPDQTWILALLVTGLLGLALAWQAFRSVLRRERPNESPQLSSEKPSSASETAGERSADSVTCEDGEDRETRENRSEAILSPDSDQADEEHKAATTIQAAYKGYRVRKSLPQKPKQNPVDMDAAATKIQATFRGHKLRTEMRKKNEAATKIQARFRGFEARKRLIHRR